MKVFITGGAGFIGAEIVNQLYSLDGYEITVLDSLSEQIHGMLPRGFIGCTAGQIRAAMKPAEHLRLIRLNGETVPGINSQLFHAFITHCAASAERCAAKSAGRSFRNPSSDGLAPQTTRRKS